MTYREKIQDMIKTIETIYDDAEWLRDMATADEKNEWNKLRGIFYDAAAPLKSLDRFLTPERAAMDI